MSEKNMDDLLAQLKAEFEPSRESRNQPRNSPPRPAKQPSRKPSSPASLEQMLDDLREELETGRDASSPNGDRQSPESSTTVPAVVPEQDNSKYRERLNTLIEQDYQMQARKREAQLAELRKQEEARIEAEKRRQQELIEAQRREELRERRRKEALGEQAQKWLKNLNPRSEEGKWFEEFSYSYESKLQAAIDYLEAMKETGL